MDINGKELRVTVSSFDVTMRLMKALADSVKGDGIRFDMTTFKIQFDSIENSSIGDIGPMIQAGLSVATDSTLRDVLFECGKKALIGDMKLDKAFFEEPENRQYFFPAMIEIARVNLAPFFGILNSLSTSLSGMIGMFQKLKSEQK